MCGICGIVDFASGGVDEALVAKMTGTLSHRGPDDRGVWVKGPVGLGHARLSIIDLSPTGHQPMATADGRYTITYNGEIYNFPEIRGELEAAGVRFRGRSDTEVALYAYAQWGAAAFSKFNGMFAIGLWDDQEKRLCLVRDRFGIKPLYYHAFDGGIVFGSEMKAILASCRPPRTMDWHALSEYLYYGNPLGRHTFFESIRRLPAGEYLTVDRGGCKTAAYWRVEEIPSVSDGVEDATRRVRDLMDKAVARHLISDVPVGVFLSGGVDSSAITALASRHHEGRLKTYSVGFDFERGVNELPKARSVAERFGTEHHELRIAGKNMSDHIEQLVRCHDEPFAEPANLPLLLLCEALKGSVKVILQGDGGDEIFAGYRRYNILAYERFWRTTSRPAMMGASLFLRGPTYFRATRFFRAMNDPDPAMRMALMLTEEPYADPPTRILSTDALGRVAQFDPFERYRELYSRLRHLDPVQRMLYADSQILLTDTFLEKVDRSTMAHSIEVRVPFLDGEMTEYVMGLPSAMKVKRGQKKWVLRRAMRGIVPDEILDGPKTGFGVPFKHWLRGPLADYMKSILLDPSIRAWGLFDQAALERAIAEHIDGARNNGFLLYKLMNLALWRRFYLCRN